MAIGRISWQPRSLEKSGLMYKNGLIDAIFVNIAAELLELLLYRERGNIAKKIPKHLCLNKLKKSLEMAKPAYLPKK